MNLSDITRADIDTYKGITKIRVYRKGQRVFGNGKVIRDPSFNFNGGELHVIGHTISIIDCCGWLEEDIVVTDSIREKYTVTPDMHYTKVSKAFWLFGKETSKEVFHSTATLVGKNKKQYELLTNNYVIIDDNDDD
jgi:hypothetical protein